MLTPATRLMSLAASRLMLWPSILAAVAVRFPGRTAGSTSRGGDGNVLGLDGGALTVLLVLALLCWVEPMLTETLTPMAAPLLGSALLALAPRLCRKVAASAVAFSMPPLASLWCRSPP